MPQTDVIPPKKKPEAVTPGLFSLEPFFQGRLFPMNPFEMMRRFTEEMEKVSGPASPEMKQIAEWRPAIEVRQEGGKLMVKADLPGVKQEEVKVSVLEGMLTIEGERQHEKKVEEGGFFHSERAFGRFCRTIALPEGANTDEATASFANGVLEVQVPVREVLKPRTEIPIQATAAEKENVH
jgi:HSP20 family protein